MGWFLVTVALPVLAPMISLICMKAFPLAIPSAQLALVSVVRNGQLCWAAIGFCTSALYELAEPCPPSARVNAIFQGYLNGGMTLLLVLASLFAACGAVLPHTDGYASGVPRRGHNRVLLASLGITSLSAIGFALIPLGALASSDFWRLI
ncbi:hypothetical protein [Cupriavidus metallidurans]|uniref:Uncharacterized protein n=1 Tax=Cupriavidus metallidurans (strain ATCC 43123 / DSM 2839 / NBRC 102507 / CH34) TaxID=266264 RepID=Q1LFX8_CUPMC|nr:hypothetical protein [Cupriavidus metallidurans]ABF10948.1 Exported or Membrane protein of unknown function [Cupriavidus metallidurans CH34]QGS32915.1 hypothetical protein FOB83_29430 [Cupriavidus metallidurans]